MKGVFDKGMDMRDFYNNTNNLPSVETDDDEI